MTVSRSDQRGQTGPVPLFSVLIFLGLLITLAGCDGVSKSANDPDFSMEVETEVLDEGAVRLDEISEGQQGSVVDGTQDVLRDEQAYASFWKRLHADQDSVPDRPEVDFETQAVVAVVLGRRPTGGYSVDIDEVLTTESRNSTQVRFTENTPGDGCVVQQVLTSPYVLATIKTPGENVTFSGSEASYSC